MQDVSELRSSGIERRSLLLAAGGVVSLSVAACTGDKSSGPSPSSASAAGDTLAKLRQTKKLKAAYILYPPFVVRDANSGTLSGLFIDLMKEVASFGQFDVEYVEGKWGTMVAGLDSRQFDLVVSGVFPTIPRAMAVDFAAPQMYVGLSGVVPAAETSITATSDLLKPGTKIAVVNGEVGHEYARKFLPEAQLTMIDSADISRALEEVVSGRVQVALTESITCVLFAEQNASVKTVFTNPPLQTFGATVMLRQDDVAFKSFLNNAFEFLQATGRLAQLDEKYRAGRPLWLLRATPWISPSV